MKIDLSWNEPPKNKIKNDIKTENSDTKPDKTPEEIKVKDEYTKDKSEIKSEKSEDDQTEKNEITAAASDDLTEDSKLINKQVEVATSDEIQIAKKQFIESEIAQLEDEIWSVMETEGNKPNEPKRKLDSGENNDNKKVKYEKDEA